ncbi:MAG: preprotein translocase subunit SecA [Candidatus Gracilibacteria bacterium]
MLVRLINAILGDPNEKELNRLGPTVEHINKIEEEYQKTLKEEDIPKKTEEFKKRLADNETDLEGLVPEAFALVKFACRCACGKKWDVRGHDAVWDMVPYDVQLLGGLILHSGKIAEMKTGEGKTLVCVLPLYLNALTQKGVHLVTVNEYLARRDAEWMGGIFNLLGLSVGVIIHNQNREEKKAAYNADITYGTNNEFGFDYLRDNMAGRAEHRVQRPLHYAIVDEVDSILIDEARTPLIISAPAEESTDKYMKYSNLVGQLEEKVDYNIDEEAKTALLTEAGIAHMEKLMGVENIYTDAGFQEVHHIEQALRAKTVYKKDIDYVVKNGEILIVDEFTGRMMEGRRYSAGLHQAIEAKEKVEIKRESKTLATITFQNYFRIYEKLAGMTGTALTEAEEFATIYKLETMVIPTHQPVTRKDQRDTIYKNAQGKYIAIAKKVKELHEKGQPVLIGTISIEKSELLSSMLTMQGVKHNVLNAKHHEREAEIIMNAGQYGAVTIATNMAGRGTDIKLGENVTAAGGLFVLGTERHESRRIDNQLRGRSGRQGDPGASQFFISLEDDLMRLFGSDRVRGIMERLGIPDDMPIENSFISKSIEGAQKKIEGRNFDIRKHLVEYDDVMNKHREIIYRKRHALLEQNDFQKETEHTIEEEANVIVMRHSNPDMVGGWDYKEIAETLNTLTRDIEGEIDEEELKKHKKSDELVGLAKTFLLERYKEKEESLPSPDLMRQIERAVTLRVIDTLWMEHIDEMSRLRERVALRGYGQRDPLIEYKQEAFQMFTELTQTIQRQTVNTLFKIKVRAAEDQAAKLGAAPIAGTLRTNQSQIESALHDETLKAGAKPSYLKTGFVAPTNKTISQTDTVTVIRADDTPQGIPNKGPNKIIGGGARTANQTGRNDPCPCGSGKKYKKCCGQ